MAFVGSGNRLTLVPSRTNCISREFTLDEFSLLKRLGQSRTCQVHLARDLVNGSLVCVKIYNKTLLSDVNRRQVLREVELMLRVMEEAPPAVLAGIVQLIAAFEDAERIALVLEYCELGDLFSISHDRLPFREASVAALIDQVAGTMAGLHRMGILHRDLKPENILLAHRDGKLRVKLCDFGLAINSNRERPQSRVGTGCFLAPEVALMRRGGADPEGTEGQGYYGPEVDMWALGTIMYEFLVGRNPWDAGTPELTLARVVRGSPEIPNWLPADARALLQRALLRDPAARIRMDEVADHPWIRRHREAWEHVGGGEGESRDRRVRPAQKRRSVDLSRMDALHSLLADVRSMGGGEKEASASSSSEFAVGKRWVEAPSAAACELGATFRAPGAGRGRAPGAEPSALGSSSRPMGSAVPAPAIPEAPARRDWPGETSGSPVPPNAPRTVQPANLVSGASGAPASAAFASPTGRRVAARPHAAASIAQPGGSFTAHSSSFNVGAAVVQRSKSFAVHSGMAREMMAAKLHPGRMALGTGAPSGGVIGLTAVEQQPRVAAGEPFRAAEMIQRAQSYTTSGAHQVEACRSRAEALDSHVRANLGKNSSFSDQSGRPAAPSKQHGGGGSPSGASAAAAAPAGHTPQRRHESPVRRLAAMEASRLAAASPVSDISVVSDSSGGGGGAFRSTHDAVGLGALSPTVLSPASGSAPPSRVRLPMIAKGSVSQSALEQGVRGRGAAAYPGVGSIESESDGEMPLPMPLSGSTRAPGVQPSVVRHAQLSPARRQIKLVASDVPAPSATESSGGSFTVPLGRVPSHRYGPEAGGWDLEEEEGGLEAGAGVRRLPSLTHGHRPVQAPTRQLQVAKRGVGGDRDKY